MKEKMLTSWSLVWLLATVLLVTAAALNLTQRATQNMPPTDGVHWVMRSDGVYAEKVVAGLAASRAGISVGDKLIGIALEGDTTQEITSPADVQMYLETAGLDGSPTYFHPKPPYSFSAHY